MSPVVFTAVSTESLGAMLKGYGILACIGEKDSKAEFWWDESGHLVARFQAESGETDINSESLKLINAELRSLAGLCTLLEPMSAIWNDKKLRNRRSERRAKLEAVVVRLQGNAALTAASISADLQSLHPLFAGFGKYGTKPEANYLALVSNPPSNCATLPLAVFGNGQRPSKSESQGGGAFFPDAIKRYATGAKWVHETDAPVTYWDYALAIRGALLLRGAARVFRGSRRSYPSFPFVFRGSPVKAGGQLFVVDEVYLPTWCSDRPRTLAELQMQIRQFQARVGGGDLASSAADFRRAVQGRGVTGGFDRFHRFVLERRKPGQRQPAVQAVARGATVVGEGATELRLLLARIDESGWLDQLEQPNVPSDRRDEQLQLAARCVHDAVHACADEPTVRRHLEILNALWQANRLLLDRVDPARVRPLPPMPAQRWERVLAEMFKRPEARIARALASIGWNGWDTEKKRWRTACPWPIASQVLPLEYIGAGQVSCRVPDPKPADRVPWRGFQSERDFAQLFHRRWLDALGRDSRDALPYAATRTAPLGDVLKLLRGQLNLLDIQLYCSALLVLDWRRTWPPSEKHGPTQGPIPVSYAALRLWLDAEINPPHDRRPNWDGSIPQLLFRGDPDAVNASCQLATSRLRVTGLPARSPKEERRAEKAVAAPAPKCTAEVARLMGLAVLVPIDPLDTERLARRLWIPTNEEPQAEDVAYG